MKYSIIIPYRDRQRHLELLLPKLMQKFEGRDFEIFILEQDDQEKFRLSSLYNIGYKYVTGDVLIFHDIDYYPTDDVVYELASDGNPTYPVRKVMFTDWDFIEKPSDTIPMGYRHFRNDVGDHWGGVFILSREHFEKINGFNPLYIGWGKEDEDTHKRLLYYGLTPTRNTNGTFFSLPHKDSIPSLVDSSFIGNYNLLDYYETTLDFGYTTISADVKEFIPEGLTNVTWLKIKNFKVAEGLFDWDYLIKNYQNTEDMHRKIWVLFKWCVNNDTQLNEHRTYIVKTRSGYGNRAFHWIWKLLVDQMPTSFKFLEIGVFMGQTLSLIQLLAERTKRNVTIYGITPLDSTDDHPNLNYVKEINRVYIEQHISEDNTSIFKGLSTDLKIIEMAKKTAHPDGYDMLYIDGGHTFDVVSSDIKIYKELVKVGGYLIMDDASTYLNMPKGIMRMDWFGILEVSHAIKLYLETDDRFQHLFAVGHNRVWRRIKE